jgi:hypothetical protein
MEGVLPLLGAAALYTVLGVCTYVVASRGSFAFQWSEAFDSLGWLYGGAILAMQSGTKGWGTPNSGALPATCFAVSFFCLLILISAMIERGRNPSWQPPRLLKILSTVLVVAILFAGYETQLSMKGVHP